MPIIEDSESAWEVRNTRRNKILIGMAIYGLSPMVTVLSVLLFNAGEPRFTEDSTILCDVIVGLAGLHIFTAFLAFPILLILIPAPYRVRFHEKGITTYTGFGKKQHIAAEDISGIYTGPDRTKQSRCSRDYLTVVMNDGFVRRPFETGWFGVSAEKLHEVAVNRIGWATRKPHSQFGSSYFEFFERYDWFAVPSTGTLLWNAKRRPSLWSEIVWVLGGVLVIALSIVVIRAIMGGDSETDYEFLARVCLGIIFVGSAVLVKAMFSIGDFIAGGGPVSLAVSDDQVVIRRTWRNVTVPRDDLSGIRLYPSNGRVSLLMRKSSHRNHWLRQLRRQTGRMRITENRFRCKPLEISSALLVRFGEQSSALCIEEAKQWRAAKKAERGKIVTTAETESD